MKTVIQYIATNESFKLFNVFSILHSTLGDDKFTTVVGTAAINNFKILFMDTSLHSVEKATTFFNNLFKAVQYILWT